MKKIMLMVGLVLSVSAMPHFAMSQSTGIAPLLSKYYDVKNALGSSDAAGAAKAAGDFVALVKEVDVKTLTSTEQATFKSLQSKLATDAGAVAATKDLAKQRTSFQSLSQNVITLIKVARPLKPAFVAYCPMKKAYWVSAERGIKNPYYGNSMLSCGNVTETIEN